MTKFTRLTQNRRQSRLSKPGIFAKFKFDKEGLSVAIFLALIISGFAYLALINSVSTRGFEIKELEEKIELLKDTNGKMEMEAAELQSMNVIAAASKQMNLKAIENPEYVGVTAPVVALGR